ncbi:MAG: pilus assembly protein PilP [Gammaproteobacteria bacterium]|nr:pilus assembly protein PilP [Gammaproteobacteria bacterium]
MQTLTTLKLPSIKWTLYLTVATFFAATLSGCAENDVSDLNTFIAEVKTKYEGQVEALPIISPYESYSYRVSSKRDPFRPSVSLVKEATLKRSSNGLKPNEVRNREGLEKYSLQSLVMVGIMNNNGQNWAIIKAPDGSIFRVRKGNYMGENNGKITRISESGIDLNEIVADGRGGWVERKNKLSLSE